MKTTKISVVVTVLNEARTIEALLQSLNQQTLPPTEVIIIDGGSSDDTQVQLKKLGTDKSLKFPLVWQVKTGNRSVGRNLGVSLAKSQIIAFTDAGCLPDPSWLAELAAASENESTVVAGFYRGLVTNAFTEAVVPYVLVMPDQVNPQTFLPATRSMLINRELLTQMGGFDETLSDNEDYALAKRLEQLKFQGQIKIKFAPLALVGWQPRQTLREFAQMIYRFAKGDATQGLRTAKVMEIYLRYLLLSLNLGASLIYPSKFTLGIFSGLVLGYTGWAIWKNYRYTPRGWYFLPLLQYTSDLAVMAGSMVGSFTRFKALAKIEVSKLRGKYDE